MSLKRSKIIGVFVIFSLCFLSHFLYEWLPNPIFSFLFPVNESIWEHMKLFFTPFILYTTFEYLIINKEQENFWIQIFLVPVISIIAYLIIYIPLYNLIGENMIVSIALLFIIISLQQYISYKLATIDKIEYERPIGIMGLIILLGTFIYLTYYPFKNDLFYDKKNEIYGIKKE